MENAWSDELGRDVAVWKGPTPGETLSQGARWLAAALG
jgi:hypothetical protein